MRSFLQIANFVVGLVQLVAVFDGAKYMIGAESFIGKFFAFLVALFLTYIPILGSALGVYGAVNVWDWSMAKSLVLFFWYIPVFIIYVGYSFFTDRAR